VSTFRKPNFSERVTRLPSIGVCPLSRESCDSAVDGTVRRIKRIFTLAIPTRHKARICVPSIRMGREYVVRRELRRSLKTRGSRRLFFPICTRMFLPATRNSFPVNDVTDLQALLGPFTLYFTQRQSRLSCS